MTTFASSVLLSRKQTFQLHAGLRGSLDARESYFIKLNI